MVGGWEISNADRDRRCPLAFSVEPAPGGYKVDFDAGLYRLRFPSLGDVVAWGFGPKDMLRLLDAKGAALMEFTEVENGMFESERGADGLLFLQTQAALKVEIRTAEQIVGDWNLLREVDKPLCRLTLSNTGEWRRLPRDREARLRQGDRRVQSYDLAARRRPAHPERARRRLAVLRKRRHRLGARAAQRRSAAPGATVRRIDLRRRGFLIDPGSE